MEKAKGVCRIWGAGGAGINTAKHFIGISEQHPELADIKVSLIDTSRSNLDGIANLGNAEVFLLPEADGSGKVRSTNAEEAMRNADSILATHQPAELNIVVFSNTGGSGSVLGPILAKKLLDKQHNVICVALGGNESAKAAKNALDTFKTLDGIVRATKQPLTLIYEDYGQGERRSECDAAAQTSIMFLALLASRQHHEFDTRDLTNWLRYDKTTSVDAQLSLLDVCTDLEQAKSLNYPVSVVSLVKDRDNHVAIPADYTAAAYYNLENAHRRSTITDIHYVITTSETPDLIKMLNARIESWDNIAQARPRVTGVLSKDDDVTDGFLVL